jgi:hypothetical protein
LKKIVSGIVTGSVPGALLPIRSREHNDDAERGGG